MPKLNIALSLAAGLLGGFLSRTISLPAVHAQNPPNAARPAPTAPPLSAPEIRAQRFTITDSNGRTIATFSGEWGNVILRDANGKELWRAGNFLRPATER